MNLPFCLVDADESVGLISQTGHYGASTSNYLGGLPTAAVLATGRCR